MEDNRGYLGDANSEWQLKHFYKPLQRNQSKPLEIRTFVGLEHPCLDCAKVSTQSHAIKLAGGRGFNA